MLIIKEDIVRDGRIKFRIKKLDSRNHQKTEDEELSVNVNYELNFKNPQKKPEYIDGGTRLVLQEEYIFAINYLNPSTGHIRYEGEVFYETDIDYSEQDIKERKQEWNESGDVPVDVQQEIANTIIVKLLPMALQLSEAMGLPPAIPIPFINYGGTVKAGVGANIEEPTGYHG